GGGRPPYGWVATGGGSEAFAPHPQQMAILRLIADRRAAGVYGPKRYRRRKLAAVLGIAAGLVVIALLIV
ncbi:MAG: hypothetical protein ACRECA_12650, partial [Pseudolabrys sp.]